MEAKKKKYAKFIWLGVGVIALGTGGYFLVKHLKKNSELKSTDDFKEAINDNDVSKLPLPSPSSSPASKVIVKSGDSGFPLKLKSKGALVKDVQNALIKKYGATILPKFGADGYYGDELFSALVSKKLPTWIDLLSYVKILAINSQTPPKPKEDTKDEWDAVRISNYLHKAIGSDNIFYLLDALKKINNVDKYKATSIEFKKTKIEGVSKTIVTAINDQFPSLASKKKINEQFYRIGLKYNGSVWSLAGIEQPLITLVQTKIWDDKGKSLLVEARTMLGKYLAQNNGIVQFLTHDNKQLYVQSNKIQFL